MKPFIMISILTAAAIGLAGAGGDAKDQPLQSNIHDPSLTASPMLPAVGRTLKSSDYSVTWAVIAGGGVNAASASYRAGMTVGQTATGEASSAAYHVSHGFWQAFESPCDCRPGDANNDGNKNVGDAVYLISYVFKGGAAPAPYVKCSGDANGDCSANVGDAVYVISYVFKGGAPPVNCETWLTNCGSPLRK